MAALPSLLPVHEGQYYSENRCYSIEARDLICCCAMYTSYSYEDVARLLRGELYAPRDPRNPVIARYVNLRGVQAWEVPWYNLRFIPENVPIDTVVAPLVYAGLPVVLRLNPLEVWR
ncbi:hypothetical protein MMC07_004532 [Pseudocyphellaria aurata]|nr:hypothetical protein [Pseudocyphellaria aurata]